MIVLSIQVTLMRAQSNYQTDFYNWVIFVSFLSRDGIDGNLRNFRML